MLLLICLLFAHGQYLLSFELLQDVVDLSALLVAYDVLGAVLEVGHCERQVKLLDVSGKLAQFGALLILGRPLGVFLGRLGLVVVLLTLSLDRVSAHVSQRDMLILIGSNSAKFTNWLEMRILWVRPVFSSCELAEVQSRFRRGVAAHFD